MQIRHWTLLVSSLMFIASIWFVLSGTSRAAASAGPSVEPVATVKQLMNGLVGPASNTVYKSVSIIVDAEGIHENQPESEEEWLAVEGAAAALSESGGLLMAEGRARDQDRWIAISQELIDASLIALEAAQRRDKEALLASGEAINDSCDACHQAYNADVESPIPQ
jgi:hypothetical protein